MALKGSGNDHCAADATRGDRLVREQLDQAQSIRVAVLELSAGGSRHRAPDGTLSGVGEYLKCQGGGQPPGTRALCQADERFRFADVDGPDDDRDENGQSQPPRQQGQLSFRDRRRGGTNVNSLLANGAFPWDVRWLRRQCRRRHERLQQQRAYPALQARNAKLSPDPPPPAA